MWLTIVTDRDDIQKGWNDSHVVLMNDEFIVMQMEDDKELKKYKAHKIKKVEMLWVDTPQSSTI